MADPEVRIIFTGQDKTQAAIKSATGGLTGLKGAGDKLKSSFSALTGINLTTALSVAGIGTAAAAAGKFIAGSVKDTLAYNKSIRELTQTTGLGAEEISRIVQIGDDWGISIDTISQSLEMMKKNGVTPSISALANLADEYVANGKSTEFAEKASKLLGRQWATLVPLFAQGGQALRDQTAAVDDNLIATEESIKAAREYEVALDTWQDAVGGLKQKIGNELIPVLAKMMEVASGTELAEQRASLVDTTESWDEYAKAVLDARVEEGLLWEIGAKRLRQRIDAGTITEKEIAEYIKLTEEEYNNSKAIEENTKYREENRYKTEELIEQSERRHQPSVQDTTTALIAQTQAYTDMTNFMKGQLGPEIDDFNQKQYDLESQSFSLHQQIHKMEELTYRTPEQEAELAGLKTQYNDVELAIYNAKVEHEKATKQILFDLLTQRAAIGELSSEEMEVLTNIAVKWGLVDEATAASALAMDQALLGLANGEGVAETIAKTDEILNNVLGIAGTHDVTFNIRTNGTIPSAFNNFIPTTGGGGSSGPGNVGLPPQGPGGQSGLHMVIPPGYPFDSYPLRASSGERVDITPAGHAATTITNNFDIHMNGSGQPAQDMVSAVRLLELLYG